jgi:Raf kinase inhibitor-like YbhB/YbcL family protein
MKHSLAVIVSLAAASLALAQPTTKPNQPEKKPDTTHPAPKVTPDQPKADQPKEEKKDKKSDEKKSSMKLTSPSIEHDKQMPKKHTVDGDPADATKKHISPALRWEGAPVGTKEFALVMFDPDAGNFVHWVIYNIPADVKEIPENLPNGPDNAELTTPVKLTQGASSFRSKEGKNQVGYLGPAGRKGRVHHYHFRLYALDTNLALKPAANRKELEEAMKGHILAECELIGTNER